MKKALIILVFAWIAPTLTPALAAEGGYTARATELKQEPFIDAPTLGKLPVKSRVEILGRRGGWLKVKADGGEGWLRMLSLRMDPRAEPEGGRKGDLGIGSLVNVARTGSSGATVTTGVRGLSEEDLKNAQPKPEEMKKLQTFAADKAQAEMFAGEAKLIPQRIDYMAADGSKAKD